MIRNVLASSAVALVAIAGCEDYPLFAEPAGETQLVFVDGQPDHCIVVKKGSVTPSPLQTEHQPAVAEGR
jgi:hypothetical protein